MQNEYLKLISGGTEIVVGETDGTDTIAGAGKLFTWSVDPNFVKYGTNVKGRPTKKARVQVFETIKDGTFAQIFGGFGENLDRLCLSQSQIIRFVKDDREWLCRNVRNGTFFLFKVNYELFISAVDLPMGMLGVTAFPQSYNLIWDSWYRYRVVVLQL